MSWERVKNCTVAITAPDGNVWGTGFFISQAGHLLTCAHVVEDVGGWEQIRVQGQSVNLVYLGDRARDDFAVLQVVGYRGEAVPLSLTFEPMDRFLSIGYGRPDFPAGGSIDGVITDLNPQANFGNLPMLRLRVLADAQRVQGGYSGSPVFDAERQCVVGLIAAYDLTEGGLAVPLATVQNSWPELEQLQQSIPELAVEPASESKQVFISYRSRDPDLSLAQTFYEHLKAAGHQPFMAGASIQLGENWPQRIDRELEQCDYFLLLLSPQSATSEMVTEEVRRAKELQERRSQHKPVILPIRVGFPLSSALNYDLRGYLSRIQQREWNSPGDTAGILQEVLGLLSAGAVPKTVESEVKAAPILDSPDRPPSPIAEPELLREPGGAVPLQSGLYVERPPKESDCFGEIVQPGALVRIKAPRQMGKTSLMSRILAHAREQGYQAIPLSFQQADGQIFGEIDQFLEWFCEELGNETDHLDQLDKYWNRRGASKSRCTRYFKDCLLKDLEAPLVLGLDEVDLVFPHRQTADDFFGMLRSWHEKARYGDASSELWAKLRLVLVHSTEIYVPLNINQSPFNVGTNIELPEFSTEQIRDLAGRYGLSQIGDWLESLQQLIGGHPYLIRKAFYHLRRQDLTRQELLETAPTEAGIYNDHLRRHLLNVQRYPQLKIALCQVVTKRKPVVLDSELAFKLESMGLVALTGNNVIPRCDLYRQYFCSRLED